MRSSRHIYGKMSGVAGAISRMSFIAPLKNSLILDRGTGSPTFTRADGADGRATVADYEGRVIAVKAGEARFTGCLRIENLILTKSNDFSNAAWQTGLGIGKAANALTFTNNNSYTQNNCVGTHAVGDSFVFSITMSCATAETIRIILLDSADGSNSAGANIVLTSTPTRYSLAATMGAGFSGALGAVLSGNSVITAGTVVTVSDAQVQKKTGASDPTVPDAYVSVGVLSAPYNQQLQANGVTFDSSATGVDGVAYSKYENGNTVASNVVTEAVGAAIADSTLLGYKPEGARTNLCLQSADFGTTWTLDAATLSANSIAAPDGTTTADRLIETAASSGHVVYQAITTTATAYTFSVYAKAGERNYVAISHDVSGTGRVFDLQNGSVGSVMGGLGAPTTSTIESVGNGWYRCSITTTASAAANTYNIFIAITDTDQIGSYSYAGDITKGIYLWGAQLELGSFASSYIPTTTAAVTRAVDADSYPNTNLSDTAGTIYFECEASSWANASGRIVGDAAEGILASSANSGIQAYDGTNTVNGTAGTPSGQIKAAISWSGTTMNLCVNGGTVATGTYDGAWNLSAIFIGNGFFGNIRNVKLALVAFGETTLQALTA